MRRSAEAKQPVEAESFGPVLRMILPSDDVALRVAAKLEAQPVAPIGTSGSRTVLGRDTGPRPTRGAQASEAFALCSLDPKGPRPRRKPDADSSEAAILPAALACFQVFL